jgi:hypothetical protein
MKFKVQKNCKPNPHGRETKIHCPKGFPTLPVYTGNVEDQTPHGR